MNLIRRSFFCLLILSDIAFAVSQSPECAISPDQDCVKKKYQLAICAIFQDETFFLKEWLEYHRLVGVEHFYLYNNLSTDDYYQILKPYMDQGVVDLFEWPVVTNNQREYLDLLQLPAYNHALGIVKETACWAAFIDLDEFLVPVQHDNLIDMLKEYHSYAGLAINWQVFGTSWVDRLPENELIIENLIWKAPVENGMNEIVKFIVQPSFVSYIPNPHAFEFYKGCSAVNSKGNPLSQSQMGQSVIVDTVYINHYWFGTMEWFIHHKISRREKWGLKVPDEHLKEVIFTHNQVKDETILKFAARLKKIIFPK